MSHEPTLKNTLNWNAIGNVFACGTALFSDGYQNGVMSDVNSIIETLYPGAAASSNYAKAYRSTVFAGTIVGMIVFGWASDALGRKFGMILATLIVFVFAALSAGSYGGGTADGMFKALAAWRFFIGVGIGAEYPAGSVACSENTEDPEISKKAQHGLFALATNSAIDWGFVFSTFVPLVFLWIFGDNHLRVVWRMSLGFGCIPPLLVFFWRLKLKEPLRYQKNFIADKDLPWWLIIKKYWLRFTALCVAWFIYDFITYPFGIYSDTILDIILPSGTALTTTFGWNVVINLFYIPGTMIGALFVDKVGPKKLMTGMLVCQAILGFGMSGGYKHLVKHVAAFTVLYGIFLSLGEAGPGNCLGLLASKSSPTCIRGKFYGAAAAIGKIGAFVGTWVFPDIINDFGGSSTTAGATGPFYVGSGMALFSALCVFLFIPEVTTDYMTSADDEFRDYLLANGYDISKIGLKQESGIERILGGPGRSEDLEAHEDKEKEEASHADIKEAEEPESA